ncbi:MAG: hypothetical protein GYB31_00135 [Bacteroidetes bacterium]|nr:hypothetical protein [Bacteroidota bacterium]
MPESPLKSAVDNLALTIKVNGKALSSAYQLVEAEVDKPVNRVGTAVFSVLLANGESEKETFAASEAADFNPGNNVEILAGYQSKVDTIFSGIIVNQTISVGPGSPNLLKVYCKDETYKLSLGQSSACYKVRKDSEVITEVVKQAGLSSQVEATSFTHPQIVRYQSVAWDFILERADESGLLVYFEDKKLNVSKPTTSKESGLVVDYGVDVIDFKGEFGSVYLKPKKTSHSWDMEARLSGIRGEVSFIGSSKPKVNTLLEIKGFGSRFNGNALISRVQHKIAAGTWKTTARFGLKPEWYFETSKPNAQLTVGSAPALSGLHIGMVKNIEIDDSGEHRLKVDIPVIDPSGEGVWARLSNFYATSGKGAFFIPEMGDEVALGFLNDDPRNPVILGMLYSGKNAPPYSVDEKNSIKAIVTKSDLKIEFDDDQKILTTQTPAGNKMIFSDKDKSITIQDQNGNKIKMDPSGISIKSAKDVTIEALGDISLKANKAVSAKANTNLSLEGLNVNAKANFALSLQGTASAELKSAANTSVKGAMIMIN